VLRQLKRRSLALLRKLVEPVSGTALGRFLLEWQGIARPRRGPDALLTVVEQLQGAPLLASALEEDVLPARIASYRQGDIDTLCAAGEVVWLGLEPLGPSDGKIALFPADALSRLAPPARRAEGALAERLRTILEQRGAMFFGDLAKEAGAFPPEVLAAIWELVWAGEVTNDTLTPLRSYLRGSAAEEKERRAAQRMGAPRLRRAGPPGSEGRWSLLQRRGPAPTETERRMELTRTLLERHGVLTREAVATEGISGGFSAVYDVLKAMEDGGRVRRGYFVAGLGATQFALPGADDRLRGLREPPEEPRTHILAATDPANPYGAALPWPEPRAAADDAPTARPQRAAGAHVVLRDGALLGYIGRTEKDLHTFLTPDEPAHAHEAEALAAALASMVDGGRRRTLLLARIDGMDASASPFAPRLVAVGFSPTSKGYFKRQALRG
jgi:ATP-dependent Lhr-like helicase